MFKKEAYYLFGGYKILYIELFNSFLQVVLDSGGLDL